MNLETFNTCLGLLAAGFVVYVILKIACGVSECYQDARFEVYVRDWCRSEYPELTSHGIDAVVKYLMKKMKDRADRWDVELYVPTSVYKRIEREYRLKDK